MPDSRSASECRERAQARKSGTNKAGVIWWSTDAEERKRREKGASPGGSRAERGSGLAADFRKKIQDIPRRELSAEAKHNSAASPTLSEVRSAAKDDLCRHSDIPRRELSARAQHDSAASLTLSEARPSLSPRPSPSPSAPAQTLSPKKNTQKSPASQKGNGASCYLISRADQASLRWNSSPLARSIQRRPLSSHTMRLWALPFFGMEAEPGFSTRNEPPFGSGFSSHMGMWKCP